MKIQFLGQSCFLFTYNGKTILSDPFYNFQKDKSGFDIKAQNIDYVLITHAHGDHVADVNDVLAHHLNATIIAQPEICGYFRHKNQIDLNIGGSFRNDDFNITMVNASHTSSFNDGTYGGTPAGYIIRVDGKTVYLAVDTGLISEMALFPMVYGNIDVAILPLGDHYTMDAFQASFAASELLKCKQVIGCHFDTFPPIAIDYEKTKKHFEDKLIDLKLPKLGEEMEV